MNSPPTTSSPDDNSPGDSFESRRANWAAAGVAGDERLMRRAIAAAVLLGCGFVAAFGVVLYVG